MGVKCYSSCSAVCYRVSQAIIINLLVLCYGVTGLKVKIIVFYLNNISFSIVINQVVNIRNIMLYFLTEPS